MTNAPAAWLSDLGYELGALVPIDQLSLNPTEVVALKDSGLSMVSRMAQDLTISLPRVLSKQLNGARPPDLILVASNSISANDVHVVTQALAQMDGGFAIPIQFMSAGDCTNLAHVMKMGLAYIASRLARDCLIVTADRAIDAVGTDPRAVYGGGLVGDGIAWCRLGTTPSELSLIHPPSIVKDASASLAMTEDVRVAQTLRGLRQATRSVLPDREALRGIVQVLPNTYTHDSAELLSVATRLPQDRVYQGNVARTGHCFAADTIINLVDWMASTPDTGNVILVGSGVFHWSACLLARHSRS